MDICVTGVSQGLGERLARRLVADGHRVWGVARDERALEVLGRELGAAMRTDVADIRSDASVHAWAENVRTSDFLPSAVVLNASIRAEDMRDDGLDLEKAEDVIDINLLGTLRCVQAFLPGFLRRGHGTFLLVASTSAMRPSDRSASYAAAKSGAAMAFRSMALRYASSGVRFKIAYLGPLATTMWEGKRGRLVGSPDRAAAAIARFLQGRGDTLFYPKISTGLLRLASAVPDSLFSAVSGRVMK